MFRLNVQDDNDDV